MKRMTVKLEDYDKHGCEGHIEIDTGTVLLIPAYGSLMYRSM